MDVGERAEYALLHSSMGITSVSRLLVSGHMGDHVGMMRGVYRKRCLGG